MIAALRCARCTHLKARSAYRVTAFGVHGYRVRDPVCRRCRGELERGVDGSVVQLRERELKLASQLARLRAKIRSLLFPDRGAA